MTQSCGIGSDSSCGCTTTRPASEDFRHAEKHVPLPAVAPSEITVQDMLGWPMLNPVEGQPRTGRELQLFHVSSAFVQLVWLYEGDCDVHLEISQTASKTAPRVIVETPFDGEYCTARSQTISALIGHGVAFTPGVRQEVTPAVPAEVLGLAFADFEHNRGSKFVATTWELHPAIVTIH